MIKDAFLFMAFLACTGHLSAQALDTVQVDALCRRAYQIHEDSPDIALHICEVILKMCAEANYLKGKGDACLILGAIYRNLGSIDISDRYYWQALKVRRNIGDSVRVAAVIHNLATNRQAQSRYDSAIALVLYAINLVEHAPKRDDKLLGFFFLSLSNLYDEYLEPEAALRYAKMSLYSFIKTNDHESIGKAAYGLGNRFYADKQLDSAEHYYNLASNNILNSSRNNDYLANILTNKAILYKDRKEYEKAEIFFQEAKKYLDKIGKEADWFHWYLNRAYLFGEQQNWPSALAYLKMAQPFAENSGSWLDQTYLYEGLAQVYSALRRMDSAYYYQTMAYGVRDSLYNENKRKEFIRFQTERYKKETLIEQANAQKAAARARMYSQAALFLGLILGLLGYAYLQRKRSYQLISRQREALHQQAVDELIQSSELKYLSAGLEGREAEKEAIGREIHDRLGSAMIALSWQYDAVLDNIQPDSAEHGQMLKLNESLKSLYQDIRHIAHQLGSGVLEMVGLVPVLEELCNDIRAANRMEVEFSTYGMEERLSFSQELNILRIVQELIGNVLKYAKATQLTVQINRINDAMSIIVEDNGIGFDTDKEFSKGVGLANVEKRVRFLNGTLQLEKRPEGGVTVIIDLPDTKLEPNHA